ncbi:MAG: hypothetical protein SV377_02970 [Halobacteria archaeon]|nr:hypothetical protein [Halobacteria archaeon]
MSRLATGVKLQAYSFFRRPLNVALLLIIPPLVIEGYAASMQAFPEMPFMETPPTDVGRMSGAVFSAAFLTGIFGLFQVISSLNADRRLVLTGYPRVTLLVTRIATILGFSLVVSGISYAVLATSVDVKAPALAYLFLVLSGIVYGLLGVVIGSAVPRELEGSIILLFVVDADAFFSSGFISLDSFLPKLFPLHYPHSLFESAVVDGTYISNDVLYAVVYILALSVIALIVFTGSMSQGSNVKQRVSGWLG